MEQLRKIVLEAPEGMHYTTTQGENGELIVRLVSNSSEKSQDNATCSQKEVVVESVDKAKFFTKITAEDREMVKNWSAEQEGKTDREESFLTRVREAVKAVNYDYWIANLEPSVTDGKIYYAKGNIVGIGFDLHQWRQMAKEYAPERCSRLSNEFELYIWYALRIVNGLWTLDYVANDSSSAGNYFDSPGALRFMEKTGARECGGFCDGQGNSYKIVTYEGMYLLVGGNYNDYGCRYPVAGAFICHVQDDIRYYSSGVLVLTK